MPRLHRLLAALIAATLVACGGDDERESITVFAAASLTDAFGEIETAFEQLDPLVDVHLNLAGSSSLREQILAGAPADVLATADEATMSVVADAGEVGSGPVVFATNRLVVAVPAANDAGVRSVEDLADESLLIGLCATGVPCGDFARAALDAGGIAVAPDTNEPDVRALLTKIRAGELDAGIVYATDVRPDDARVLGIEIPSAWNVEARYPIGVLSASDQRATARAFVDYVLSPAGQAILRAHGFGSP